MSKSNKTKYRWYDEEDEYHGSDKKTRLKNNDRRKEKKIKNAIKGKNFDYLIHDDEY